MILNFGGCVGQKPKFLTDNKLILAQVKNVGSNTSMY